jgi:hypothetical protein
MNYAYKRSALVLAVLAGAMACGGNDYLTGPGLTISPNSPTVATKEQFLATVAASQQSQEEGQLARIATMFTQQMSGVGRQQKTMQGYAVTEADVSSYFSRTYTGGGLLDIRKAETMGAAAGDSSFAGIAMVYEALMVGRAASIWGDIPLSEAVGDSVSPHLDPQEQVYVTVQAKLDTAILWIPKSTGANTGPGGVDLVYSGDRTKWVAAANTLKARYYMHWAEAQATGGASATAATVACGGSCITKARDAAALGIKLAANDFRTFHSGASTEWNFWYQFMVVSRAGDLGAGQTLIDTLKNRRTANGDQRIKAYFDSVTVGATFDFRGGDRNGNLAAGNFSQLSATRLGQGYRQPIISAAETYGLLAEAESRLGNDANALAALNNAKAQSAAQNAVTVPAAVGLVGAALLREIKAEEYIGKFQTIEVWNDYKRNCYPVLTPAGTATEVPGRLQYGSGERSTNPNIPSVAAQPARNRNDPKGCSDPTHAT